MTRWLLRRPACIFAAACSAAVAQAQAPHATPGDDDALRRIRTEAVQHTQVMTFASTLTDGFGARLTNSPAFARSADWAVRTIQSWGIPNARLERWGPFGWPSWESEHLTARITFPANFNIVAFPAAWSASTNGRQEGEVIFVEGLRPQNFAEYKGKLRGKWVIALRPSPPPLWTPRAEPRYSDSALQALTSALPPRPNTATNIPRPPVAPPTADDSLRNFAAKCAALSKLLVDEGALGLITPFMSRNGPISPYDGSCGMGIHETARAPLNDGHARTPPVILVASEDVGRMLRLLDKGTPVRFEADMGNRITAGDNMSANIIAELSGSDPSLSGEVVMLGAHLDSWHVGTGATDNGGNAAVILEAFRLLKASGVRMRRTVRLALWGGEEQGLLGSTAYVRKHFGWVDSTGLHKNPEYDKLAAYFNLDNGVGSIRGVYLQGNAAVQEPMARWIAPLRDMGVTTLSPRQVGATDHVPFANIGLPAFQFIQDPLEYFATTWHTSQDTFERIPPGDLIRNSVIVATMVYQAANHGTVLPRM